MPGEMSGVGTKLRRWDSVGEVWEDIANVKSITGPGMSRTTLDTTALDVEGGYRTFITGLRDGGNVQFVMNFTREQYDLMKTDFESNTAQNYEIYLSQDPDETSFEFTGLVTELPLNITEDIITCQVTIKISGQVVSESGSGS